MKRLVRLALIPFFSLYCWALSAPVLHGHFSLQGGIPRTEAHLIVSPAGHDPLSKHLQLWMTGPGSIEPIHRYDVEMTKQLHLIVVSSDFSIFLHVHPQLGPDGRFSLDQQFPQAGLYYLYADGEPASFDHQVFRFDVGVGEYASPLVRSLHPTGNAVTVGPYLVQLDKTTLHANGMDMLTVHILKDGRPAPDLHPYLGALAHAVFLNSGDLSYVHAHPMALGTAHMMPMSLSENTSTSSPDMMLHVELSEPGTYKLWLQFRGGDKLYVAPFVLTAQ